MRTLPEYLFEVLLSLAWTVIVPGTNHVVIVSIKIQYAEIGLLGERRAELDFCYH